MGAVALGRQEVQYAVGQLAGQEGVRMPQFFRDREQGLVDPVGVKGNQASVALVNPGRGSALGHSREPPLAATGTGSRRTSKRNLPLFVGRMNESILQYHGPSVANGTGRGGAMQSPVSNLTLVQGSANAHAH